MNKVIVTGASGELGARVVAQLFAAQHQVVALDKSVLVALPVGVATSRVDLESADLESLFGGADSVVHLSSTSAPDQTDVVADELDLLIAKRVVQAATHCWVGQVVLLSSAVVYGAQPENPLPLAEDAPLRPNPEFYWALGRAAIEEMVTDRRETTTTEDDEPAATQQLPAIAILRPTAVVADAVVADEKVGRLAQVLDTARLGVDTSGDQALQFLHVDDLVSAVVTAVLRSADGVFNVAPDGWTSVAALRDFEGPRPRLRVPLWMARVPAALRLRARAAPLPSGIVPYVLHPWVIANDRLKGLGWVPTYSNEEAWVVSQVPSPLDRVPASRRQQLALAIAALAVGVGIGLVLWLLRRISKVGVVDE